MKTRPTDDPSALSVAESPVTYPAPVSAAVLEEARRLVAEFTRCFWFWHPEATVDDREDVLLVIRHLREYGGHRAWAAAQALWKKCR